MQDQNQRPSIIQRMKNALSLKPAPATPQAAPTEPSKRATPTRYVRMNAAGHPVFYGSDIFDGKTPKSTIPDGAVKITEAQYQTWIAGSGRNHRLVDGNLVPHSQT